MRRKPSYILIESSRFTSDEDRDQAMALFNAILASCRQNANALETLHISVIIYGESPNQLYPLVSIVEDIRFPNLIEPGYGCMLGKTMRFLNRQIKSEVQPSSSTRKGDWLPSILLISSGNTDDAFDATTNRQKFAPVTVVGTSKSCINNL